MWMADRCYKDLTECPTSVGSSAAIIGAAFTRPAAKTHIFHWPRRWKHMTKWLWELKPIIMFRSFSHSFPSFSHRNSRKQNHSGDCWVGILGSPVDSHPCSQEAFNHVGVHHERWGCQQGNWRKMGSKTPRLKGFSRGIMGGILAQSRVFSWLI